MKIIDLQASATIHIPGFCAGFIPHNAPLTALNDGYWVFVGAPDLFQHKGLMVLCEAVPKEAKGSARKLVTPVFNLSNKQVRIRRGEIVSRILCWDL